MNRNKSIFSRDDRKHIAELIENLKNDEDYVAIFEILMNDSASLCTKNSNGVFLNLSSVNDKTLKKIKKYLGEINKKRINQTDMDINIIPNGVISKNDRAYKLSNYEKNILKQRTLKKVLNDDSEYEELKIIAKNKKPEGKKPISNNKYC